MPIKAEQKPSLHSLLCLEDRDLRYNTLKMLLTDGITLIKHSVKPNPFSKKLNKPHLSTVKISDTEFFYTSKKDPRKKESDLYNHFSMYSIKFVRPGNIPEVSGVE